MRGRRHRELEDVQPSRPWVAIAFFGAAAAYLVFRLVQVVWWLVRWLWP